MPEAINNQGLPALKREKKNIYHLLVLFLIWPFAALLASVKRYRLQSSVWGVILFCAFYGFTFILASETSDGNRYQARFIEYSEYSAGHIIHLLTTLYSEAAEVTDPVTWVIFFLLSRITSDPVWLFTVFAFVFGFFYGKNIWFLLQFAQNGINKNAWVYFVGFIMIIPIFQMQGFRMWTAAHIFFFGAIQVIMFKEKKYLWFALLAFLFHFSYILPGLVLLGFYFLGRRNSIYIPLLFLSIIIQEVNVEAFGGFIPYLGRAIEEKFYIYAGEGAAQRLMLADESRSWFLVWENRLLRYMLYALFFYSFLKYGDKLPISHQRLFSFTVFFMAIVNFVGYLPSLGRFYSVLFLFALAFLFLFFQHARFKKWHWANLVAAVPVFLMVAIALRRAFGTINAYIFTSNPFIQVFIENEQNILQLLRSLI